MAPWLLAILAWLPVPLFAADGLTRAVDLQQEAVLMVRQRLPMLVLFSQAGCSWCEQARRLYVVPMSRSAPWKDRALFRQIDLDSDAPLTGFDGQPGTHRGFARAAGVFVTPTVMIFGPDGRALVAPIVGMRLPDFYGQYLEQALETARDAFDDPHP